MSLRFKPFDKISADDLKILIRDEVTEQIQLEYKRSMPGHEPSERIEYLKDISSFANARGGYIIYGMEEENGLPKKLMPISKSKADQEILKLAQMAESGIRPRIQGLRIRDISHSSGNCVFIAQIPPSFNRPHMVTYRNHSRFYSRNSKGVFQMDVDEIRQMVVSSQDLVNRMRGFRRERIERIAIGEKPTSTSSGPYVVMHIIPFDSFSIGRSIDLSAIEKNKADLSILGLNPHQLRFNFDGILGYHHSELGKGEYIDGYIQVFRSGSIEMLRTLWDWNQEHPHTIPAISIENWILKSMTSICVLIDETEIDWPISIGVTLLYLKDYEITLLPWISGHISPTIEKVDRNEILIPEVVMESSKESIEAKMLPVFNTMWNAAAWPKSYAYNEDGSRDETYSFTRDFGRRFHV
ncbi:MAG: helix-turn-helix domain-containing protein [Candidatus Thorarchaeota archaeon]